MAEVEMGQWAPCTKDSGRDLTLKGTELALSRQSVIAPEVKRISSMSVALFCPILGHLLTGQR